MAERIKNIIGSNITIKLIALALATVLWFFVVGIEKDLPVSEVVPEIFK